MVAYKNRPGVAPLLGLSILHDLFRITFAGNNLTLLIRLDCFSNLVKFAFMSTEKEKYPSVDLAYKIAIASFEVMSKQWHSINSLLHALLSISLSFVVAVPLIAKAANITVTDKRVIAILVFCGLTAICCMIGRLRGSLRVIDPGALYAHAIQKEQEMFKRDMVHSAGKEFKTNQQRIKNKWYISLTATVFLVCQILALVFWILCSEDPTAPHTQKGVSVADDL